MLRKLRYFERISILRRILTIAALASALIMSEASMPVATGSAQSINLSIDFGGAEVIFKKKIKKQRRQRAQASQEYKITPSQAARIAQTAFPGSKPLKIRALQGKPVYVVTLRSKNRVHDVRVNAITGAIAGGN
jgi:uncharacterized membrane protein YkoI